MSHSFRTLSPGRIDIPEKMEIRLTEVEEQICTLLDECTKNLARQKDITTSCRIAGGWVRDKVNFSFFPSTCFSCYFHWPYTLSFHLTHIYQLLGSQSNDIDIALTDMMGYPFALEFNEFANETEHIIVKAVSKVKGNPGQSKHLETAKTSVLGVELDFVNLRDEEYAEGSRIPTSVVSDDAYYKCSLFSVRSLAVVM